MQPCPHCNKPLTTKTKKADLPFCSERCKLVDLSKWLDGDYRIPGPPAPDHQEH